MSDSKKVVIIWLDQHIGQPDYCQTLRNAFSTTLDPTWSRQTRLDDINIDNLIKDDARADPYSHKSSAIKMYAFDKPNDCAQCLQKNKGKRIFFIVSNLIGQDFVPRILKTDSEILQKSADNQCGSVYVFCSNIANVHAWVYDYIEYVQVFDHEIDLLVRLTRDIGDFFVRLGQEQYGYKVPKSINQSLKYFHWAKTLYLRANEVEKDPITSNQRERHVDSQIVVAEALLQQLSNNDDDIDRFILRDEATDEEDVEMHEFHEQDEPNTSSFPFSTEKMDAESSHLLAESANISSSDDIKEKLPAQIEELIVDQQNSSDIHVFLQLPSIQTKSFEKICQILKQLFNKNLTVVQGTQDYLKLLKTVELPIIVLLFSTDDDKLILEKLCTLSPPPSIYLLGLQPETANEKQEFFTKYSQVCAMLNSPEELAIKVALDVALKRRIKGDCYTRNKETDHANQMFDRYIELLNQLDVLAKNNM